MTKTIWILSILFMSVISVYYVPMKKEHEVGEHICRYQINDTSNIYVRPCEEGKYCAIKVPTSLTPNNWEYLYTCENYTQTSFILKQLDETCDSTFDCDSGLICKQQKCIKEDCDGTNQVAYRGSSKWECTKKNLKDNNFYYFIDYEKGESSYSDTYSPYSKLEGEIKFYKLTDNIYTIESITNADYRGLDDGKFVSDKDTCKSGYYLYFYPDGSLTDPYSGTATNTKNTMYKMCVTFEGVNYSNTGVCQIIYSINNGGNKTYNVERLSDKILADSTSYSSFKNTACYPDKLKLKILQKYVEAMTEEKRAKCNNLETGNYKTCKDDELTKWYYLYNNPNIYSLYYNEDEEDDYYKIVVRHLIQSSYGYFQIGSMLNIKNAKILLLFLLSLLI